MFMKKNYPISGIFSLAVKPASSNQTKKPDAGEWFSTKNDRQHWEKLERGKIHTKAMFAIFLYNE